MRSRLVLAAVGALAATAARPARADDAIDEATTPLPLRTQITFKPSYTFPNGDSRYKAEIQFESLLPYSGVVIPGLEASGFWSVARVQLPVEGLENGSGAANGIGDLSFVDLAARHLGPFNVGAGYCTVFPMATSPALGQGKWQVGPAVGMRVAPRPFNVAFLVQNLYSVAGNSQSPDVAYVKVQPFITLDLPADFFVSTDATMSFSWRGGGTTVPVDLGLGRAFGDHFVGTMQFWYTLAGSGEGDIRMRAVLNFEP
jgi:hypothetical protein